MASSQSNESREDIAINNNYLSENEDDCNQQEKKDIFLQSMTVKSSDDNSYFASSLDSEQNRVTHSPSQVFPTKKMVHSQSRNDKSKTRLDMLNSNVHGRQSELTNNISLGNIKSNLMSKGLKKNMSKQFTHEGLMNMYMNTVRLSGDNEGDDTERVGSSSRKKALLYEKKKQLIKSHTESKSSAFKSKEMSKKNSGLTDKSIDDKKIIQMMNGFNEIAHNANRKLEQKNNIVDQQFNLFTKKEVKSFGKSTPQVKKKITKTSKVKKKFKRYYFRFVSRQITVDNLQLIWKDNMGQLKLKISSQRTTKKACLSFQKTKKTRTQIKPRRN